MKLPVTLIAIVGLAGCTTTQAKQNVVDAPDAVIDAPVKALNLKKTDIPEFLENLDNPYVQNIALNCKSITAEVKRLTEFAGPDWDSDEHYTKQGRTTSELVDAILPYGGLVRFVSGASEYDKKLDATLNYATVRRGYLKALGEARGCKPPASPIK